MKILLLTLFFLFSCASMDLTYLEIQSKKEALKENEEVNFSTYYTWNSFFKNVYLSAIAEKKEIIAFYAEIPNYWESIFWGGKYDFNSRGRKKLKRLAKQIGANYVIIGEFEKVCNKEITTDLIIDCYDFINAKGYLIMFFRK